MPNYIIIRLRPSAPKTVSSFGSLISGSTIEVSDLNGTVTGSAPPVQHSSPQKSVASAAIDVSSFVINSGKIDCRIKIQKSGNTYVEVACYNLPVFSGTFPNASTAKTLQSCVTLIMPDAGTPPVNRLGLTSDGAPPKYSVLKSAVTAVTSTQLHDLTLSECEAIADTIKLPQLQSSMNANAIADLENMYTAPNANSNATFINDRFNYESQVNPVLDMAAQEGYNKTLNYVYALAASHWASEQSVAATSARINFPPCPACTGNSAASQPDMSVILNGAFNSPGLKVEAALLYVYGAAIPVSISREQRWEMAKLSDPAILISDFDSAMSAGIITSGDTGGMSHYRAAHVLNALNIGVVLGAPMSLVYNNVENLIHTWLNHPAPGFSGFWTLTTGHLELALWALTEGHAPLIAKIKTAFTPGNAQYLVGITNAQWKSVFYDDTTEVWDTSLFPPSLSIGTNDIRFELFLSNVKKYYAVEQVAGIPDTIDDQVPPGFAVGQGDPLATFIGHYEASGLTFNFDQTPDHAAFQQALNCTFPNDPCAREWLENMLQQVSALAVLTVSVTTDKALQFSLMEALYSVGFTTATSITTLTFSQFQQALTGTVAYPYAEALYVSAGGSLPSFEVLFVHCQMSLEAQGEVMAVLTGLGVHEPQDILEIPYAQLQQAFACANLSQYLECIYRGAGGDPANPQVVIPGSTGFQPINPEGKLVNCIPQKHRSPTSNANYLKELLLLKAESSCKDPFAAASTSTKVGGLLAARRGDLSSLQVSISNYDLPIPMVDIALESLHELVKSPTPTTAAGKVWNTAQSGYNGLLFENHDPANLLESLPEHSLPVTYDPADSDEPYNKLRKSLADCCLPYDQALDVNRSYLGQLGVSRYEILRTFRKEITDFLLAPGAFPTSYPKHAWKCPPDYALSLEYLCISPMEMATVFTHHFEWPQEVKTLCDLLEQTCLEYCEFYELLQSGFMNLYSSAQKAEFPTCETCCCEAYQVWIETAVGAPAPINGTVQLGQLIQFTRLWKKLQCLPGGGYSFAELADIAEVLGMFDNSGYLNPAFITELASFQMLRDVFGLPLTDGTPIALGATSADRTHLLALWAGAGVAKKDWAIGRLLDKIQDYAQSQYGCKCRAADFIKILEHNLDPLSKLLGFIPGSADYSWDNKPSFTFCFAEVLSKIYASHFTVGEILDLFNTGEHLAGDDPFPQQTNNEAIELPFDLPEGDDRFSLWKLRDKLLSAAGELPEGELHDWTWTKMTAVLTEELGYQTQAANDYWESLGAHFFPQILEAEGWTIAPAKRQYRIGVTGGSPAAIWNTPEGGPFRYDNGTTELYCELPLTDAAVVEKLSRMRQLKPDEQAAVQAVYYSPRLDLARFSFLFSNFHESQNQLIQEADPAARWGYFQRQFALFYSRCHIIADHLEAHVAYNSDHANNEGNSLAWAILRHLLADENRAFDTLTNTPKNWEDDNGTPPPVLWDMQPNGGAFSALLSLCGTGLLSKYYRADGSLIWQELRGGTEVFSEILNRVDLPVPTVISNLNLNKSHRFAKVQNGLALANPTGELLGGAEGYKLVQEGVVTVEKDGSYSFRAGAPTPAGQFPDFEKACGASWLVTLKRGHRKWILLSHQIEGETAPAECSAHISLRRGAYDITIEYIQPTLSFETKEESCPQTTGFQLKYYGPDTEKEWVILPFERLFVKTKDLSLRLQEISGVIDDIHTDLSDTALDFLGNWYYGSLRDIRATAERAFHALLFAHRFQLSAQSVADDGVQSEIGYFLAHPVNFAGTGYYLVGVNWAQHFAQYNFNFLPVDDNYFPQASAQDDRRSISGQRSQALFDWWCRMFDYARLRQETMSAQERPAFLLFNEAAEDTNNFNPVQLLHHFGIDLGYTDDDSDNYRLDLVTCFYDPSVLDLKYEVQASDLMDERWAIRVFKAAACVRKMLCHLTAKDLREAKPFLWASPYPEKELGNANLTAYVTAAYLDNGSPIRYKELTNLNNGIRERSRKALINWLAGEGGFASAKHISEYLLIDVEAGICQSASRIESAITAVQLFINRALLGLEPLFPVSNEFRLLWAKQFSTYNAWEKCKRREWYVENCIEHTEMEAARKSASFRFFEDRLRRQTLTIPVSGGTAIVNSPKPPVLNGNRLLQKQIPAIMTNLAPPQQGYNLMGSPQTATVPSWLSAAHPGQLPFWVEAAIGLKKPFLSVAAAGIAPGLITYDCEHGGCCTDCCDEHGVLIDQYYFWLVDGHYFEAIRQDASLPWDDPAQLPALLHWESEKMVWLLWARVQGGKVGQMRRSSEGVPLTGASYGLAFKGRHGDSLELSVTGDVDTTRGFRYDLAVDVAVALPAIGQTAGKDLDIGGLTAHPYFAYYEAGAPVVPPTMFAPALAAACNMRSHCNFNAALQFLEHAIRPLAEDNTWLKCAHQQPDPNVQPPVCCENLPADKTKAARRALLLHYLEIMVQWATALMRQNSPEAFQQARLLYDTATKILGECPKTVQLCDLVDSPIKPIADFEPDAAPLNPRLICIYEQVEDGLAQIRHCENAQRLKNGKPRRDMNYWGNSERACGCRGDYCTCNSDCDCSDEGWCAPTSPYRFTFLLNKSLELAGMVSSFGNSLLSAIEKGESERLNALRETHAKAITDMSMEIRQLSARSAEWEVQGLEWSLTNATYKLQHYTNLILVGLIQPEQDYISHTIASKNYQIAAKVSYAVAQILKLIPDLFVGQNNFSWLALGTKAAGILETVGHILEIFSTIESIDAQLRQNDGHNERRLQEWLFIQQTTLYEIQQIIRQLLAAKRRYDASVREVNVHQVQMQHAAETLDFLRDKFTNGQFYQWQQNELAALHYQLYECAIQTARQANTAFVRERRVSRHFIDCKTWDNLYDGLLAGERLQFALRQMEKAYLDDNVREYELTKPISLFHQYPEALLQLKATGYCEFDLPEWLFDQDYPGHYMRRIKSVALSIPCVVGPYKGVYCNLGLLSSAIRVNPTLKCAPGCGCSGCSKGGEHYEALPDDCRLAYEYIATESIATSMAQNDSGLFQLDFRDERFLPFEGYGAISRWRLELPKANNFFDLHTVSDVIVQLSYMAREGGSRLKELAAKAAQDDLPGNGKRLFDVKNDLPEAWYALTQATPTASALPLHFSRNLFPFLPYKHQMSISCVELFVEIDDCNACDQLILDIQQNDDCRDCRCDPQVTLVKDAAWSNLYHGALSTDWALSKTNSDFGKLVFPQGIGEISRVYLLVCYDVTRQVCEKHVSCDCGC